MPATIEVPVIAKEFVESLLLLDAYSGSSSIKDLDDQDVGRHRCRDVWLAAVMYRFQRSVGQTQTSFRACDGQLAFRLVPA